jgi:hypothetical protein
MSVSDLMLQKGIYLGRFNIRKDVMDFEPALTYSKYIALGDIVYFMYVNNKLVKIGKAGGAKGWNVRMAQYKRGRLATKDYTNHRIMDIMESCGESEIEVYAVQAPRREIKMDCPLTGETFTFMVETHRELERSLTTRYLNEQPAQDLPFCKQLK